MECTCIYRDQLDAKLGGHQVSCPVNKNREKKMIEECPYCGETDLSKSVVFSERNDEDVMRDVECGNCEKTFFEVFRFYKQIF